MTIDSQGSGMTVECPNCKDQIVVPDIKPSVKIQTEVANSKPVNYLTNEFGGLHLDKLNTIGWLTQPAQ